MFVLGIETATQVGSVAVVNESGLVGEHTLNLTITHSERLLPGIDRLLDDVDLSFSDIDALAVSIGPGSFTGLRIGISTVKGLALAGKKPLVGVPTLDGLVQNYGGIESLICPMLDARKNEIFVASYRRNRCYTLQKLSPDLVVIPKNFLNTIHERVTFLGNGSERYRPLIEEIIGSQAVFVPPHMNQPRASNVAFLGMSALKKGETRDINTIAPIYVRPSDAERSKQ